MSFPVYLKCVWANKATLAGYLLLPPGLIGISVNQDSLGLLVFFGCWFWGIVLLTLTAGGLDTMQAYLRTKEGLSEYGVEYLARSKNKYFVYCGKVGYRLAVREFASTEQLS